MARPKGRRSFGLVPRGASPDMPLEDTVGQIEAEIIKAAVSRHGSVGKAAKALGVALSTFDNKRKKHGLIGFGEDA